MRVGKWDGPIRDEAWSYPRGSVENNLLVRLSWLQGSATEIGLPVVQLRARLQNRQYKTGRVSHLKTR